MYYPYTIGIYRCDCDADGVNGRHRQHSALDGSPRPSTLVTRAARCCRLACCEWQPQVLGEWQPHVTHQGRALALLPGPSVTLCVTVSQQVLLFDDKERQERHNAGRRPSLKEVDKWAAAAI
eukprot:scaffold63449_cov66-Phaeocystis_antarctica.AAC.3